MKSECTVVAIALPFRMEMDQFHLELPELLAAMHETITALTLRGNTETRLREEQITFRTHVHVALYSCLSLVCTANEETVANQLTFALDC